MVYLTTLVDAGGVPNWFISIWNLGARIIILGARIMILATINFNGLFDNFGWCWGVPN